MNTGAKRPRFAQARSLLKRNVEFYRSLYNDQRTPRLAKWLLRAAIGYMLLPFDLIPDFIPAIGHLDDLVVTPLLIMLAIKMVPKDVYREHRERTLGGSNDGQVS